MEHETEGVDIAAGIDLGGVDAELLGAHVADRADEFPLVRGGGEPLGVGLHRAGDAKVDHLGITRPVDQDVGRLEVAVHDALAVGMGDAGAGPREEGDPVAGRQAAFPGVGRDGRRVGDQFHQHERPVGAAPPMRARRMHVGDRRMPQSAEQIGFVGEPARQFRRRDALPEHLQRHHAIRRGLAGLVDPAHATFRKQPNDRGASQQRAGRENLRARMERERGGEAKMLVKPGQRRIRGDGQPRLRPVGPRRIITSGHAVVIPRLGGPHDRGTRPLAGGLADCGTSLPSQEAAIKWKKAMDGFFHGQLAGRRRFGSGCCRSGQSPARRESGGEPAQAAHGPAQERVAGRDNPSNLRCRARTADRLTATTAAELQLGCQDDPHRVVVMGFEPENIRLRAVAVDLRRGVPHLAKLLALTLGPRHLLKPGGLFPAGIGSRVQVFHHGDRAIGGP